MASVLALSAVVCNASLSGQTDAIVKPINGSGRLRALAGPEKGVCNRVESRIDALEGCFENRSLLLRAIPYVYNAEEYSSGMELYHSENLGDFPERRGAIELMSNFNGSNQGGYILFGSYMGNQKWQENMRINPNRSVCIGLDQEQIWPIIGQTTEESNYSLYLRKNLTGYNNPQFTIANENAGARLELYSKDAGARKGNIGLITRTDNGSLGDFDLVSQNGNSYRSNLSVKADGTTSINGNTTVNGEFKVAGTNTSTQGSTEFRVDANGFVWARDIRVDFDQIPDYVFDPSYKLMSLEELKSYLAQHKHLPNVPSAAEYEARGSVSVSELNLKLLEKVEELTLYVLQLKNEIDSLKSK